MCSRSKTVTYLSLMGLSIIHSLKNNQIWIHIFECLSIQVRFILSTCFTQNDIADEAFYFSNLFLRGIQIIVDEILIIKFLNYCIFSKQTFFQGSKRLQMIYLHRFGNWFLCNVPQEHILRVTFYRLLLTLHHFKWHHIF